MASRPSPRATTGSSFPGSDRYGRDVLAPGAPDLHRRRPVATKTEARQGLVVEDATTGWCGAITRVEKIAGGRSVELEDRHGRRRSFPLGPGFLLEGQPVILVPARNVSGPQGPARSASGSVYVSNLRAREARGSRLWVEGKHDAELVEKVWGHDLRVEGVVVELLEGADHLVDLVREFQPGPNRRLGVLLDHLITGSKESRIAEAARSVPGAREHLLVLGHPFVDIWQAVRPARVGLASWPDIPRGTDIKVGTLRALGWPASDQADIADGWQRILSSVRSYADLDPALLGRVEELIDFVTATP
ncbi:DUF3097 domain-containing protein [Devriesea agamarum]|uniref:DUF3097 domain-containing protein n=1 Tax=Devriesea agamarum TaxID=472569 RepID=UPI00071CD849|nr:DUF3097 domain-containing protein [Devriesea agamarum]